jgi:hypothetical protein
MTILSKSKYLKGLQCPKLLWTECHNKEKIPEPDILAKQKFEQGTLVGELATKLFPEGIQVEFKDFKENLNQTKELLKEKKPLFEPGFLQDQCFSRADILVPVDDQWDIIEVKSGTKVKEINIQDVAFQKYCYEACNLKIRKCFLLHINNEYIRKGEIEIDKLFKKQDITEEVENIKDIQSKVDSMFEIINSKEYPKTTIGKHCKEPYDCPLTECKDFLPENHIFQLYRGGKRSFELFDNGIHAIKDIPKDFKLNPKQEIQRECAKTGKPCIHKDGIKSFLNMLDYPLYYLDFETFSTAVPMFDDLKPYQQVPFQFSLHVVKDENSEPEHYAYLYDGEKDPRKEFISELKKVLGEKGSVVVYNESFEKSRLLELAKIFPEYEQWVKDVNARVVDLLIPFRNFHYYDTRQNGSASIKYVLPVMTDKSYNGMEIAGGAVASVEYLNAHYGDNVKEKEKVRENLLKYCELDTLAEVMIVEKLKGII